MSIFLSFRWIISIEKNVFQFLMFRFWLAVCVSFLKKLILVPIHWLEAQFDARSFLISSFVKSKLVPNQSNRDQNRKTFSLISSFLSFAFSLVSFANTHSLFPPRLQFNLQDERLTICIQKRAKITIDFTRAIGRHTHTHIISLSFSLCSPDVSALLDLWKAKKELKQIVAWSVLADQHQQTFWSKLVFNCCAHFAMFRCLWTQLILRLHWNLHGQRGIRLQIDESIVHQNGTFAWVNFLNESLFIWIIIQMSLIGKWLKNRISLPKFSGVQNFDCLRNE